tara:strand:+ start:179512 stop:179724 length:213 start_codon:yes stop_codon:yes gene_type:complete
MNLKEKFNIILNSDQEFIIRNIINDDGEAKFVWSLTPEPGVRFAPELLWKQFDDIEDCVDEIIQFIKSGI